MPTPVSPEKATRELSLAIKGHANQAWKVWPLLPPALPPDLVLRAMKKVLIDDHAVGVVGRSLPDEYFPLFLEAIAKLPLGPLVVAAQSVQHVEARRREVLGEVLKQVGQLGVFSASASQLHARARAFATGEPLVEACRQILLVADREEYWPYHRLMLVSVLMEDASDASMDVLIAEAHRALAGAPDEVDELRECLRWCKPPKRALGALSALLDSKVTAAGGPAALPVLAKAIGLAKVPARLTASFATGEGPLSVHVELDTGNRAWWSVSVSRPGGKEHRTFGPEGADGPWTKLPALTTASEYSAWLRSVLAFTSTRKLEGCWLIRSSLRGKDRERLLAWLSGR